MRVVFTAAQGKNAQFRLSRFWKFLSFRKGMHRHNPAWYIEVSLSRLLATACFLAILGYLSATAALAVYWGNRPHSPVTYWDVFWPGNWDTIRPKQGQMLIAQADEYFDNEKYREAFQLYRSGLRMYPEDSDARLVFSLMLAQAGMLEEAGKTLSEGLDYGYPGNEEYLATLMRIIALQQNIELLKEVAPKLLASEAFTENPSKKYSLLRQFMRAQLRSGDFLGAIQTAQQINADPEAPFKAHQALVLAQLRMGSSQQALDSIKSLKPEAQKAPQIKILEAAALGQLGDKRAMMSVLRKLIQRHPAAWRLKLSAIRLMLSHQESRQADSYIDVFLTTHINNQEALSQLAVFLTDLPDSKRLQYMVSILERLRPELVPSFQFFVIQALITEGQFKQARQLYREWVAQVPEDSENRDTIKIFGDILAAATDGGSAAQATLLENLRKQPLPPEAYWEAALAMQQSGKESTALEILNIAAEFYPAQPALKALRNQIENPEVALMESRERALKLPVEDSSGSDLRYPGDTGRTNPPDTSAGRP